MIVVDASAAVMGLVNHGDARTALGSQSVSTPHLADSEVANALRGMTARNDLAPAQAVAALSVWGELGIERYRITGLLPRVWELRANLSGYDASYVALAEALGCPLLTADARLANAPGPTCPITVVRN